MLFLQNKAEIKISLHGERHSGLSGGFGVRRRESSVSVCEGRGVSMCANDIFNVLNSSRFGFI